MAIVANKKHEKLLSYPSLHAEEIQEEVTADEALWDAQFLATNDNNLATLVASVEAEINEGKTQPMFDERRSKLCHSSYTQYARLP